MAAAAAELALFIGGQIGTKWPFMPPKEPIVIGAVARESPPVYRGGGGSAGIGPPPLTDTETTVSVTHSHSATEDKQSV